MQRLAAIAATLFACQSAIAVTVADYADHLSVEVGQSTVAGMYVQLVGDAGQPAPGVGYTFTIDGSCATFIDGSTTFSSSTDEGGFATSPRMTGHVLVPECGVNFTADGLPGPVDAYLFVFDPADVVLSTNPAQLLDAPLCRSWKVAVYARVGNVVVYPHAVDVSITAAPNGATGTLVELFPPLITGGPVGVVFRSNDKQGRYELQARYGTAFVAMPVEQKKSAGACLPF